MRLTVSRSALLGALSACCEVAPVASSFPAHACVVLETLPDSTLRLRATDGYQTIALTIPVSSLTEAGATMVSAKDLCDRISKMPDGDVELWLKGPSLICRAGKSARFTIATQDASTASAMSQVQPTGEPIAAPVLFALLRRVQPFMSNDESREYIACVRLRAASGQLVAIATAPPALGCRASIPFAGSFDVLLPRAAVKNLCGVLGKRKEEVTLGVSGADLFILCPGLIYSARLTDAVHPPLEQVTPPATGPVLRVNCGALSDAVEAVKTGDPHQGRFLIWPAAGGVSLVGVGQSGTTSRFVEADNSLLSYPVLVHHFKTALAFFSADDEVCMWAEPGARRAGGGGGAARLCVEGSEDFAVMMPSMYEAADLASESPAGEEEAA